MSRQTKIEAVVFVLLVTLGVALRLWLKDVPNFAPVAALALFAGYYFRSWALAAAAPLCVMLLSDLAISFYHPAVMAAVYGMLVAPTVLRGFVRRIELRPAAKLSVRAVLASVVAPLTGLVGCSLAASVAFFLVTNFTHWMVYDMYDHTVAGLLQCYAQALPFFRYTLTGDLVFSLIFFGGYALALQVGSVPASEPRRLAQRSAD